MAVLRGRTVLSEQILEATGQRCGGPGPAAHGVPGLLMKITRGRYAPPINSCKGVGDAFRQPPEPVSPAGSCWRRRRLV